MTRSVKLSALTFAAAAALAWAAQGSASWAGDYKAPHNAFGQPDLSGTWTNASVTQLERPAQYKSLVMTPDQAKAMEKASIASASSIDSRPSDPKAGAPAKGEDPGGYNAFWIDPGTRAGQIKGEYRSSWLTDPADGRLPWSADGRKMFMKDIARIQGDFANPEARQLAEQCLLGFGSTAGPPMMNVLYNNTYQIQQDADHVAILVEMDHDVRIIRLGAKEHLPAAIRPWMGDSIGHWEGDTLVVETTNFNPGESLRPGIPTVVYLSADAKVTERFTRISATQILYEFKVEDPKVYTKTWRGEMPFNVTRGPLYEYACHEGNYALPGILAGARHAEAQGKKPEAAGVAE
jgi:hypothetical protein